MTREEAIRTLNFGTWRDNLNSEMSDADSESLFEALDMAISALKQQQNQESKPLNGWISVKDRLPDYMGEVLVIVSGKPHENITLDGAYEIAEYDPVEGWILEMWPEWCSGVVTHWMPLPEPPEEDEAK